MAGNIRIPPAVNEVFVSVASQVCNRARMDYDEWLVNSQELTFHLQERWRESVEMGLNTEDAKNRALQLFGDVSAVAKSLRKPWLQRLLFYKRFRSERFGFFILAYFLYTWVVIFDTHWKDLMHRNDTTPFQILLPFGLDFFINGIGSMIIGLAAAGCVVLAQWQPFFHARWLNRILTIRYLLLLLPGYALFAMMIRSPLGAYTTLTEFMVDYSPFTSITIPFFIMHVIGIAIGGLGAICLMFEIFERGWNNLRTHITFAGFLLSAWVAFAPTASQLPFANSPEPPAILKTTLDFNTTDSTTIGKQVRDWLNKKHWIGLHLRQELIQQKQDEGRITQAFRSEPQETYDFVYFYEDGTWKFHDIRLHTLRGINFDVDLSLIIREHGKAQGFIMLRNDVLTDSQKEFVRMIFNTKPFQP
jgi:hypothetical protein